MLTTREQERELLDNQPDPVSRSALKATFHVRRYMPLYVFGTIWAVMIALLPTLEHHGSSSVSSDKGGGSAVAGVGGADNSGAGAAAGPAAGAGGTAAAAGGGGAAAGAGAVAAGARGPAASTSGGPVAPAAVGTGTTRAGVACKPGVRQLQFSQYAAPCVAAYSGNNGGSNGVRGITGDTITIAVRATSDASGPNAQALDKLNQQAGNPSNAEQRQILDALVPYFNKNFELFGRQVKLVDFNGQGNGTSEAQSQGQDAACADADAIASSVKAFGVIELPASNSMYVSQPFAECAKRYGLYLPLGAPYFPELWYQRWDPYVWAGTQQCERIAHDVAEYIGKRLANRPAKWAGDATYKVANRKFATYVPNNDGYQRCVNISETDLKTIYHVPITSRYNYTLDVSQFPSEAAKGIVQFHAAGATTIIMACDPYSSLFLMQQADNQQYHPEWLDIGVALQDSDSFARLWESGAQDQSDGHVFGMSQLGDEAAANAKAGEANTAYKAASGKDLPLGGYAIYAQLISMYNQLQAGGPTLNITNLASGSRALPTAGGPTAPFGTWSFAHEHTAIIDSKEVFWDSKAIAVDGKAGNYIATYGGQRFQSGQWNNDEPPIKPE